MIARVLVVAMATGTLSALALAGASPAQASQIRPTAIGAGVPPSALMGCNTALSDTGGWLVRDVISQGTSSGNADTPVRPRSARFYEPCFDTTGFSDPVLNIPLHMTDIPVEMVDRNNDGMDDGPPTDVICNSALPPRTVITATMVQDATGACRSAPILGLRVGPFYYGHVDDLAVSVTEINLNQVQVSWSAAAAADASPPYAGTPSPDTRGDTQFAGFCKSNVGNTYIGASGSGTTSLTEFSATGGQRNFSCNPGYSLFAVYAFTNPNAPTSVIWGVLWRADDLALPNPGTGFYGETQAAQYSFGASTAWDGVQYTSNVVCSSDYEGANRTTHNFAVKAPGTWDNADRSQEPPIIEGGVATSWDAKISYYPTNVLSGGVYASNCPFIQEINMWVCVYANTDPNQYGCLEQNWDAERYRVKHPYQGTDSDSPQEVICLLFPSLPGCYAVNNPDSLDADIVCEIQAEGEFFEWIVSWITLLPDWIGCMTTPEGWDRSNALGRGWEASEAGMMQRAFHNSMPSSIGCGVVANIPFESQTITLDTCEMDFAPEWVKTTLGWILILGLAGLGLRRLMWSIGGNK